MRTFSAGAVDALLGVATAVDQYVIEADASAVDQFHAHLAITIRRLESAKADPASAAIETVPADVRATLRDYRDRTAAYIERIRKDLTAASEGLAQLASTIQRGDSNGEERLKQQINQLKALGSCTSLSTMKGEVYAVAAQLSECAEQLRAEKNAIIAELKGEITTLHHSLEQAHRDATLDQITGLLKRDEFERELKRKTASNTHTGIIHVWLRELAALATIHSPEVIGQLLTAFSKRLKNVTPGGALAGRCRHDVFCLLMDKDAMRSVCTEIARACAGGYVCVHQGSAITIQLRPVTTEVTRSEKDDGEALIRKLDTLRHAE